jgi:hypothetical protein
MSTNVDRGNGLPVYNHQHNQAARAAKAAMTEGQPCCLCQRPMYSTQRIDLDHASRDTYRGLAHAHCNRSAGATKGNRTRGRRKHTRQTPPRPVIASRNW